MQTVFPSRYDTLDFISFALDSKALAFGEFVTKAGRLSPYFFNAGLFNDGFKLLQLGHFYAQLIVEKHLQFDMLFGPAYKGIPLATAVALALAQRGVNVPVAYNRKEAKDHGEGGVLIGAPLKGRVLIIDDVISAGTATRESIHLIAKAQATPFGIVIALNRQEKASEGDTVFPYSTAQYISQTLGLGVHAIATLDDILSFLNKTQDPLLIQYQSKIQAYRSQYGA